MSSNEWNNSQVMSEFAKIAAESGLITSDFSRPKGKDYVGNPSIDTPVKDHRRYEPGEEYNITKETGKDLIEKAHPKDAVLAESMGKGGLVENIVQQQERDIEIATNMPSGALVGKHAQLITSLIALANDLEGEGKADVAARIDKTIERISGSPFVHSLHKEAWLLGLLAPFLKTVLWGGAIGGAAYSLGPTVLSSLTSTRENLAQDIQDVIGVAAAVREDDSSLSALEGKLRPILSPYVVKFRKPIPAPGDEKGLQDYLNVLGDFANHLPDVNEIVTAMTAVKGGGWGGWWEGVGLGPKARLTEKLKDMKTTFHETLAAVQAAAHIGKTQTPKEAPGKEEINDIVNIQKLLSEHGLEVPQSGKLDDATKKAIKQLETQLDTAFRSNPELAEVLKNHDWTISGSILRPDGTVTDSATLQRLIALKDKISSK